MSGTDVIVAGAGIIGTMIAWHLARAGASVTLADPAPHPAAAHTATWASAGGLRRQGRSSADQPLTARAAARWPQMQEELADDIELSLGGHLHIIEHESDYPVIEDRVAADRAAGLDVRLIGSAELREIAPSLTSRALAAAWTPGDGQAHPGRVARAVLRAFEGRGGVTRFGAPVSLIGSPKGVRGVSIGSQTMTAPLTVVAAGAWSMELLAPTGISLPLRWRALTMLLSDQAEPGLLAPTVTAVRRNLSLKQLRSGQFMFGGNWLSKPTGYGRAATPIDAHVAAQWSMGVGILPLLSRHKLVQSWAGAEAQSPDGNPLIGRCRVPGLYIATGCSNHGFQTSPAVGEAVADDIRNGGNAVLAHFDPHRLDALDQAALDRFANQPLLAVA